MPLCLLVPQAKAQTLADYLKRMTFVIAPFGQVTGTDCRRVQFERSGPWQNLAIPDGVDERNHDYTWSIVRSDLLRVTLDLTTLDEDKVTAQNFFDLDDIKRSRERGTTPQANAATVVFTTARPVPAEIVDLAKVASFTNAAGVPESELGVSTEERRYVLLVFTHKEQADMFANTLKKAIVACKAISAQGGRQP
ncbi:MAG: hypothetical protein PW792_05175 [Acidobacteriaceae bacterium]|nr:hypothetical protein [Acidobacteriaceae bacterium]